MFSPNKNPNIYFICAGKSDGESKLTSFDGALLQAGVGNTNLIRLSSILPPNCQQIDSFTVPQGSLLPIAYATLTSDAHGATISSAVAIAIPKDRSIAGVIMEHSGADSRDVIETKVRAMATEAMRMRNIKDFDVKSLGIEAVVNKITSTFAAVALWWN